MTPVAVPVFYALLTFYPGAGSLVQMQGAGPTGFFTEEQCLAELNNRPNPRDLACVRYESKKFIEFPARAEAPATPPEATPEFGAPVPPLPRSRPVEADTQTEVCAYDQRHRLMLPPETRALLPLTCIDALPDYPTRAAGWLAAIETELSKPKPRKPIVASEPQRIGAVASALVVTSAPGAPWSLKIATPRAWVFVHPFASGAACLEAGERRREAEFGKLPDEYSCIGQLH